MKEINQGENGDEKGVPGTWPPMLTPSCGDEPAQEQLERKEKNREGNTATGPLKLRL